MTKTVGPVVLDQLFSQRILKRELSSIGVTKLAAQMPKHQTLAHLDEGGHPNKRVASFLPSKIMNVPPEVPAPEVNFTKRHDRFCARSPASVSMEPALRVTGIPVYKLTRSNGDTH